MAVQKLYEAGTATAAALQPPSDSKSPGCDSSCVQNQNHHDAEDSASHTSSPAPLKDVVSHDSAAAAGTTSIYDLWSPRQRAFTLAVVSICQFLSPISQNIVLPGLKDMELAFHTNATATAGIIACFVFAVGVSSLAWGPFCDLLGRKPTYLASTTLYAGATVGCIFSTNIKMLLAFRTLQGAGMGAYRGAGIGSISDVFPPCRRGLTIGILMMSTLVGPVMGPLLGGFLSQAYGWQAPFVFLLVFSAGIIIPSNIFLVRETHQYKLIRRLDPSIAQTVREGPGILANPPKRGSPWAPLVSVCDKRVIRHLLQASAGSACLMSSQTSLTGVLAAAPYNMSPGMIGVAFITMGCAGMIASPLGGRMFDRAGARSPQPMPRLMWNTLASLIGLPTGLLIYGLSARYKAHLAQLLAGMFLVNTSFCIHFPAFTSYLSIVKQKEAATASSGQNALMFISSGVLVLAGSAMANALGMGWYMTVMAAIYFTAAASALAQIVLAKIGHKRLMQALPARAAASMSVAEQHGMQLAS